MRHRDRNDYWLCVSGSDVGLRLFPRAGSTSIGEVLGVGHDFGEFCNRKHKACVVRNPWDRLMSVWYGMVKPGEFQSYALTHKSVKDLDDWLLWLAEQDPYNIDAHITPMWAFLDGWWRPKDDELITMASFFRNPPFGLPRIHVHKNETSYKDPFPRFSSKAFDAWHNAMGEKDYDLWVRAQKSPLVQGANRRQTTA